MEEKCGFSFNPCFDDFFLLIIGPPPSSDDLEASPKKSTPVSLMSLNVEMPETSEEKIAPQTRDMKLPQGLEEVLAFKSKWATQQVKKTF